MTKKCAARFYAGFEELTMAIIVSTNLGTWEIGVTSANSLEVMNLDLDNNA